MALRWIMWMRSGREYGLCSSAPLWLGQCIAVHHWGTKDTRGAKPFLQSLWALWFILAVDRFDRIIDYGFNHKAHKDHRGLAKVNTVPDNRKNLLCGLCALCELCGLYRRRSVWSDYRLRILTTKSTKITKVSQRLIQFLITRKTFSAGFVLFVSFVVYYFVANQTKLTAHIEY